MKKIVLIAICFLFFTEAKAQVSDLEPSLFRNISNSVLQVIL